MTVSWGRIYAGEAGFFFSTVAQPTVMGSRIIPGYDVPGCLARKDCAILLYGIPDSRDGHAIC